MFAYADTILIGYFMTNTDVGIYRVAFQLTGAAAFITGALHTVLFPRVSGWHAETDLEMISHALARSFTYSLLLAVPVTVGGILLGDRLLYFLYGAAFEGGAIALPILFLVQIANVFMYLETMCLNAMDQPRTSFTVTAIAAGAEYRPRYRPDPDVRDRRGRPRDALHDGTERAPRVPLSEPARPREDRASSALRVS